MKTSYKMLSEKNRKEHEQFEKTSASLTEANQVSTIQKLLCEINSI